MSVVRVLLCAIAFLTVFGLCQWAMMSIAAGWKLGDWVGVWNWVAVPLVFALILGAEMASLIAGAAVAQWLWHRL